MSAPAEPWFHNAIVDGVALLHSLCLDGRPAAEVVTLTARGWIEVLWRGRAWQRDRDQARLSMAFVGLAGAVQQWPAPRQLLDHLPPLPPAPALALSVPPINEQRRAELAALRRRLADNKLASPHTRNGGAGDCAGESAAGMIAPATEKQGEHRG